jgi:hypothetical protein
VRIPIAIVGHATSLPILQAFAQASMVVDMAMLREGRYAPLYESGIRYRNERRGPPAPGVERFQLASSLYAVRHGDCDDLAPLRAAELQLQGVNAIPYVIRAPGIGYHVVTLLPDGSVEDPSARLGMLR